jgi:hypothetical protein
MSHLSIERLAALADEQPTADELVHLTQCAVCARERDAHRSLLAMAGSERQAMGLPLTRWDTLSHRLKSEGLIAKSGSWETETSSDSSLVSQPMYRFALRAAAVLLLVGGGMVLGRATTNDPVIPGIAQNATTNAAPVTARTPDSLRPFSSVEEALRYKEIYSTGYQRVLAYLAQNESGGRREETPAVMRQRLAVMDQVSKMMKEAVSDAPFDPVINDFYLNSFGQREATLRQLNNVLPQNVRLNSF